MRTSRTTVLALVVLGLVGSAVAGYAVGTGTVDPPPRIAFVANGRVAADALAAGGTAGQLGAPVFTTRQDRLSPAAHDGLVSFDPEVVIVLGGPVAIDDDVMDEIAAATGLSIVTDGTPDEGIVRVAGGDRYATAAAIAELLDAYTPAYLPVDATALEALVAGDADTLDGMDASDFARSDSACTAGQIVAGIGTDGQVTCVADAIDGGDADTLDGMDASDFLDNAATDITTVDWRDVDPGTFTVKYQDAWTTFNGDPSTSGTVMVRPDLPSVLAGTPVGLSGVEVCNAEAGVTGGRVAVSFDSVALGDVNDVGCRYAFFPSPLPLSRKAVSVFVDLDLSLNTGAGVKMQTATFYVRPLS